MCLCRYIALALIFFNATLSLVSVSTPHWSEYTQDTNVSTGTFCMHILFYLSLKGPKICHLKDNNKIWDSFHLLHVYLRTLKAMYGMLSNGSIVGPIVEI